MDIDNLSYTIDVNKLEKKIKYFKSLNKKISAIIATDFAGHPCDWKALKSISLKYNIYLVMITVMQLAPHIMETLVMQRNMQIW